MTSEITRLRPAEVPLVLELMRAFYAHERFDFDAEAGGRMLRHLLAHPHLGALFLARQEGLATGYLVLTHGYSLEFGGPFVLLDELFVLAHARGQGLGKTLIGTASAYCREHGFGYLRLEVQKRHARAVALYRACGFRTEARHLMSLDLR